MDANGRQNRNSNVHRYLNKPKAEDLVHVHNPRRIGHNKPDKETKRVQRANKHSADNRRRISNDSTKSQRAVLFPGGVPGAISDLLPLFADSEGNDNGVRLKVHRKNHARHR